ncbi:chitobiase/beta-hexosaminidase C-terminal domain-containing protein, partial [Chromatiaceae bacterium AAb-1]|nr:chitobiase/beta-hexosaminidase C-terminal domain-containing protein [Chromatiaceae bacterium AAb-1]
MISFLSKILVLLSALFSLTVIAAPSVSGPPNVVNNGSQLVVSWAPATQPCARCHDPKSVEPVLSVIDAASEEKASVASAGTVVYWLQGYKDNSVWLTEQNTGPLLIAHLPLPAPGSYRYRIKACDNTGCSAYSPLSVAVNVLPPVVIPSISPAGGTYERHVNVALSTATSGATLRYTTNNTAVIASSPLYNGSFTLTQNTIVRVRGFRSGMADSAEQSASFTVLQPVATPAISPNGGTHTSTVSVSLSSTTSGATLRYTTNSTAVTASSPVYSGPFTLSAGATVRVKGFKSGMAVSDERQATFKVIPAVPYTPSARLAGNYIAIDWSMLAPPKPPCVETGECHDASSILPGISDSEQIQMSAVGTQYYVQPLLNGLPLPEVLTGSQTSGMIAFGVAGEYQFRVKACNSDGCSASSGLSNSVYIAAASVPVISPAGGTHTNSVSVSLSSATSGATLRYTTNNAAVTVSSPVYSGPFTLTQNATVRVKGFKSGMAESAEHSASFTVLQPVATPSVSPNGGAHTNSVSVSLSSATSGATLRYTTDNTVVTASSPVYGGPFTLTQNATVRVKGFKSGMAESAEHSASFTVLQPVATPAISPNGGTHTNSVSVSLSSATSGATLRYTTNNTAVTVSSPVYSGPFILTQNATVRVKGFKSGMAESAEHSASFTVLQPVATPSVSPNGGAHTNSVSVSLSSATSGATLRYTTDNTAVTASSPVYSGPFTLTQNATVRVKGFKSGLVESTERQALFIVNDIPAWVQIAIAPPADTVPEEISLPEPSVLTGAMAARADVAGGQAVYQIPLALPPGRNQIQPTVSLSYHSQGGNGIAGVGWSLNTGSAIERCAATFTQDGFSQQVMFNEYLDRLCLDGQRLIAVSGYYGESGTSYRTETESFVKVIQHGSLNQQTAYFEVSRPDGSVASYGSDAGSRFIPQGGSNVLSWKIRQEAWSYGMNTIDYMYLSSMGEHLLSAIYYTGSVMAPGNRAVRFNYESRNDTLQNIVAGRRLNLTKRLASVTTEVAGQRVHEYRLSYRYSDYSRRSMLAGIVQCGYNGVQQSCLPATVFDWLDQPGVIRLEPFGFNGSMAYPDVPEISAILPRGDVNGDGVRDWPGRYVNAEGVQTGTHSETLKPCYKNFFLLRTPVCVDVDINMDGLTDDWRVRSGKLEIRYTGSTWQTTNIVMDTSQHNGLLDSYIAHSADYNGDGWPDLMIYHHNNGQPQLKLYLHTRNVNQPYVNGQTVFNYAVYHSGVDHALMTDVQFMGDMTGNGLPDLITVKTGAGMAISYAQPVPDKLLKNTTITPSNVQFTSQLLDFGYSIMTDNFSYFIDINGDGLPDWIGWTENADRTGFGYRQNLGNGSFSAKTLISGASLAFRPDYYMLPGDEFGERFVPKFGGALKVHDINNDGRPELLVPGRRIYTGCTTIFTAYPAPSSRVRCGDELYGFYYTTNERSSRTNINSAQVDDSIYQFDAIYFDIDSQGRVTAYREPTELYGHAYESVIIDAYGSGISTMLFNHRLQPGFSFTGSAGGTPFSGFEQQYGVYINRHFGSGQGLTNSDYQPVDYLKAATDGLGNRSEWRYRPLSSGEQSAGQPFYQVDHQYQGDGYLHFASSMYAVQSLTQTNGVGGYNQTQYAYQGAMYHFQGRGFAGFRGIYEYEQARDKTVYTLYHQKFPFVSLPERQTVALGQQQVGYSAYQWQLNPQHQVTAVYHPIQTLAEQTERDVSGQLMATTVVESKAADTDAWGNVSRVIATVTDHLPEGDNHYTTEIATAFTPDEAQWWLRRYSSQTTRYRQVLRGWAEDPVTTGEAEQWLTRTVNAWNITHKMPEQVTLTASGSACLHRENISYNDYGLPVQQSLQGQQSNCSNLAVRQTSFIYTADGSAASEEGYLPLQITNAKGHVIKTEFDMGRGLPLRESAPNNIVTQYRYDVTGRLLQQQRTGLPALHHRYLPATDGMHRPESARYMIRQAAAGSPVQEQYYDSLGRLLRVATEGFNGNYVYQDTEYDALGRILRESLPYEAYGVAEYTEYGSYDGFDRPGWRTVPNGHTGGLRSVYYYQGLHTEITVQGRQMSRTYNRRGWLLATTDAEGGNTRFGYDAAGQVLVLEDVAGNKLKTRYNGFGHKLQVDDPNQGVTQFGYNSFGEADTRTDANGVVQQWQYDQLGRITRRTTTGGNTPGAAVYQWDSQKQGLLDSEAANGVTRNYTYTPALQLRDVIVSIGAEQRQLRYHYDSGYGRLKATEYPGDLMIGVGYNSYGYQEQLYNVGSGYVYQHITAEDAAGRLTSAQLAGGMLEESRQYSAEGLWQLAEVRAGNQLVHSHRYTGYDTFNNLLSERNNLTGEERFYGYDDQHRLVRYETVVGLSGTEVNYAYDIAGNLQKKSDYSANMAGAYRYGGNSACAAGSNAGPNAVCQVLLKDGRQVNFGYDRRGNQLTGDG